MKKITTVLLMICVCFGLSAQVKARLSAICDWDDEEEKSYMGGVRLELIGENLGFGLEAMGNDNSPASPSPEELYETEWQGELFASYHLFGKETFIDPYLSAGVGCAGRDIWSEAGGSEELNLSLYPSLSFGLNAVFEGGLILGFRNSCRPENNHVPHSDIPVYDLAKNQTTLQIGYQFGGREKKEREKKDFGCWKWCWCEDCDCGCDCDDD